ncbi:hypothetical protein Scep_003975 [Stephania cephalantha]|uniref:Uncharacterized protein n=1 Tax=Stephania cephalantha TaxID=152367 RepID=A0AAP0KRJ6_9MAGN
MARPWSGGVVFIKDNMFFPYYTGKVSSTLFMGNILVLAYVNIVHIGYNK